MASSHSVKSFYSVHDAVNYAEENGSPSDENFIDISEIPPPVNELTDEEDFDDEILDDENRDPTFILQDVPGSVELHRYDNEEELTQPKGKKGEAQISLGKRLSLIFQDLHHQLQMEKMKE